MNTNEGQNRTNDPSAMDKKSDVESSNDNKIDQDFPGYPHYPAKEDIMNTGTDNHRVDLDVENFAAGPNASGLNQRYASSGDGERQHMASGSPAEDGTNNADDGPATTGSPDIETGIPQNISNEDLEEDEELPGSDLDNKE